MRNAWLNKLLLNPCIIKEVYTQIAGLCTARLYTQTQSIFTHLNAYTHAPKQTQTQINNQSHTRTQTKTNTNNQSHTTTKKQPITHTNLRRKKKTQQTYNEHTYTHKPIKQTNKHKHTQIDQDTPETTNNQTAHKDENLLYLTTWGINHLTLPSCNCKLVCLHLKSPARMVRVNRLDLWGNYEAT